MRNRLILSLVTAMMGAACSGLPTDPPIIPNQAQGLGAARAADASERQYDVTITNLTTGQPLSPPVVVAHARNVSLFQVGAPASEGVRQVAENGSPVQLAAEAAGMLGVAGAATANVPAHRIGGPGPSSVTVRVGARGNATHLSVVAMLICTNDGIAAVNSVRLPGGFQPTSYDAATYDAGTEANTEAAGDIVPPCFGIGPVAGSGGGGRTATSGVVQMHPGIGGGAALTAAHAWSGPAARVTIQRVK